MTDVVRARLQKFSAPGSLGIVQNTRYLHCFWPSLDKPTALFATGSSGIQVMGPPTPRNVIFPDDTVFLDRPDPAGGTSKFATRADCTFVRDPNTKNITDLNTVDLASLGPIDAFGITELTMAQAKAIAAADLAAVEKP